MTNLEYLKSLNTAEEVVQFCNIMRFIGNQYSYTYYGEIEFLNSEYNKDYIDSFDSVKY